MEHVYSSMDIGSNSIKIVVCELHNNHLNLLATTSTSSKGIKRGLIVNPKEAISSIQKAIKEVEDMLGIPISKVVVTVPSQNSLYRIVKGRISIDGIITSEDMSNAYSSGIKQVLPPSMEAVNVVPIDFKVNDKTIMKNPKNFKAQTLMGRAMMVSTPKKNVYSVVSALESLGIEVVDISVTSIGDIFAFKDNRTNTKLGTIVNIGSDITTVNLYNKGIPAGCKIIDMGGNDIDGDIAYMYKISKENAKKVKEKFAFASKRNANPKDYYEIDDLSGRTIKINQLEISEIVEARMEEIFSLVKKETNLLTNRQIQYIIITGGVSNTLGIDSIAQKILGNNAEVGSIKLIGVRNNKYSTALGNIIYFIDKLKLKGEDYTMFSEEDMEALSSPDNDTSNETMLGKVFGYFFGE